MKLKVWWVLGYDQYYPRVDNFVASFYTAEEAYTFANSDEGKHGHNYTDVVNIMHRLFDKFDEVQTDPEDE